MKTFVNYFYMEPSFYSVIATRRLRDALESQRSGHGQAVYCALDEHANPNGTTHDGHSFLGYAAKFGLAVSVTHLLQFGAKAGTAEPDSEGPLFLSTRQLRPGTRATVAALLEAGLRPCVASTHGDGILQHLFEDEDDTESCEDPKNAVDTLRLLVEAGARLEQTGVNGESPPKCWATKLTHARVALLTWWLAQDGVEHDCGVFEQVLADAGCDPKQQARARLLMAGVAERQRKTIGVRSRFGSGAGSCLFQPPRRPYWASGATRQQEKRGGQTLFSMPAQGRKNEGHLNLDRPVFQNRAQFV